MRFFLILLTLLIFPAWTQAAELELLNVSYDPTREFYEDFNTFFIKSWKDKTGRDIKVTQSHGGSAKQARAVIDGLQADVVTLALAYDIDMIAGKGHLLPLNWQSKLPHNSSPYTSTIVFLVRKGNPKHINDWDDLVKPGTQVITPSPKTSGGARWNYLAAWAYANEKFNGDEKQTRAFMAKLFKNVPVLDAAARGATTTFVHRGIGDVLIAWENEAYLAEQEMGKGQFEVVLPSVSILTEPPVAVVEENAKRRNTLQASQAYLNLLYTLEAQEMAAKHFFRPADEQVLARHEARFPKIKMATINDFGGWQEAQKKHFSDNGVFDQIYEKQ
jgi:sulfate/thiosulfate transport system substrate-binding protein